MTDADHGSSTHVCGPGCPHHGTPAGAGWTADEPFNHLGYRRAERAQRFPYLGALRERVLVFDGGTGTELFKRNLTADDYGGERTNGCPEWLLVSRPDIMPQIHQSYLAAGADVIETDSFGAMPHVLAEFGLADRAEELARRAAETAVACARAASTPSAPRFVAGAMGPGTKLISLGHIAWDELFASYRTCARGLIAGGADLILIETCQDLLQVRCAVSAARAAMRELRRELPIQVQVTMETTGQMLAGSDIAAALTALESLPVDVVGMNCATGPDLMDGHLRHLAEHATRWLSCQPNAGLPRNVGGQAVFDLTPDELARWQRKFVQEYGLNIAGGCCGTGPEHIRAVKAAVGGLAPGRARRDSYPGALASLYGSTTLRQDAGLLLVGERTNATGSKAFRELLFKDDLDGMTHLAQEQVAEGCHVLDVSVAWTGRNERQDMDAVMARFATAVQIPIMVDSTQPDVLEIALKRLGGRAIINSVNLEDGEEKLDRVCRLAKAHGAALVALTIDEDREAGMAKTVERKVAIAERLYRLITERHGIPGSSILFDLLTFPITQGDEDTRKLGLWTLEGIAAVKARLPDAGFILGVSNVSFGVKPYARQVLNSVFLDEAIQRGLSAAIVNAAKIIPLNRIPPAEVQLARDLIHDRRTWNPDGSIAIDPLFAFVNHFTAASAQPAAEAVSAQAPIEERLRRRIIDGRKVGIEADLDEARGTYAPVAIINDHLLDGMKTVGELFGSGKMQLPFVLQSAETMKAAVRHLEKFMEKADGARKGSIVLATVKGDVHDIGKNLVDIILSNNGYRVFNLGIKQPVEAILKAAEEHRPDAIGLSGLLVKSTVVMQENLAWMAERGYRFPVICGGAALNRAFVENDLRSTYAAGQRAREDCQVHYASDAFAGLQLMEELCGHVPDEARKLTNRPPRSRIARPAHEAMDAKLREGDLWLPDVVRPAPAIPRPPFWGRKVVRGAELDLPTIAAHLNANALFRGQWGFRQGQHLSDEAYAELVEREAKPVLKRLIATASAEGTLDPAVAWGFFPCASEQNHLVVFDPDSGRETARFRLPRASELGKRRLCIADFFRPRGASALGGEEAWIPAAAWAAGARDVLAAHVVTMGAAASRWTERLFAGDSYQDYLYAHGFAVEMAEALAEWWHKRIRQQLGIAGKDALDIPGLFTQGYQGSRYSFGYPACPRLEDQAILARLLQWEEIGIRLSEEFQLEPEQSTSALIVHHPEARYFNL
jgi:5-methyltetrahydrofolate--homocysteine methyltransferase